MSRFFSQKHKNLKAYTPGEQPRDMQYIKLNTNESPYPPSPSVLQAVTDEVGKLGLYSDPECTALVAEAAKVFGVKSTQSVTYILELAAIGHSVRSLDRRNR